MNLRPSELAARCDGVNLAASVINDIAPALKTCLAEYVDAVAPSVLRKDRTLRKDVESHLLIAQTQLNGRASILFSTGTMGYSIRVIATVQTRDDKGCTHYAEQSAYLADLTDGRVTRIYPKYVLRTDWTPDEVKRKANEAEEAQDRARILANELTAFNLRLHVS